MGQAADLLHSWGDACAVGYSTAQTLLLNASVAVACTRAAPTCKRPSELSGASGVAA